MIPLIASLLLTALLQVAGAAPYVELSEVETDGPLFRVREVRVTDRIWILDAGNHRIVAAAPGAKPVTLGRKGRGPGELSNPITLYVGPDSSVAVWENNPPRMTVYRPRVDGEWSSGSSRFEVRRPGLSPYLGYPLGRGAAVLLNTSYEAFQEETKDARAVLGLVQPERARMDTLATFPRSAAITFRTSSPRISGGFRLRVTTPYADAPPQVSRTSACGGLLAVAGTRDSLEVLFFDAKGKYLATASIGLKGPPTTQSDWEYYLKGKKDDLRRLLEPVAWVDRYPPISKLRLTASGHLLVQHSVLMSETPALRRWTLWPLSRRGDRVGLSEGVTLSLPAQFEAEDLSNGIIWGVARDELGEETVRGYPVPAALNPGCRPQDGGGDDQALPPASGGA